MTTTDKIRRMLAEGKTAKEIAKKLKINSSFVHTVKWQTKKTSDLIGAVHKKVAEMTWKVPQMKVANKKIKDKPTKLIVKPENLDDALRLLKLESDGQLEADKLTLRLKKVLDNVNQPADLVNSPPHYTKGGIDFLDYAEAKGLTENAYLFNVVKYVSRAGKKVGSDPIEDLKKAEFYLKREIANRERA